MPPQVNAALVKVSTSRAASSTTPATDWDVPVAPATDPDATGPLAAGDKWAGRIPAYLREKTDRVADGGELNLFVRRTLYVDTAALPPGLDTDDELTILLDDLALTPLVARARTIATAHLAGVPSALATTRIDLEDA